MGYDDENTFKKVINIYVSNPLVGSRKCCVEITDYTSQYKLYDGGAECYAEQDFKRKQRKISKHIDPDALVNVFPREIPINVTGTKHKISSCHVTLNSTKRSQNRYYALKKEKEKLQENALQREKEIRAIQEAKKAKQKNKTS